MNRWIAKICRRNEYMAAQKTAQDVMDGEDHIVDAMKRFANDAKCVEYLAEFKSETETKIGSYRSALVGQMKEELSERALKQLQSIAQFEAGMGSAMQNLVVSEAASSFREAFPSNDAMQGKAFSAAVKGLAGGELGAGDDPVAKHFNDAFASLQGVDLSSLKGNSKGSLAERVAFAQQSKEVEFQETFMVTAAEAKEVKALAAQAKSGDDYDFSKLPKEASERLDSLYASINAKVGYAIPAVACDKAIPDTSDSSANSYVGDVNAKATAVWQELRDARLRAFAKAF